MIAVPVRPASRARRLVESVSGHTTTSGRCGSTPNPSSWVRSSLMASPDATLAAPTMLASTSCVSDIINPLDGVRTF